MVTGNTIIDASDIGITHFGGKNTIISYNTVRASPGNYGMFAGINIGPVTFGDVSGGQVVGNQVMVAGYPVTVDDVVYLVEYLFFGGPPPAPCPL